MLGTRSVVISNDPDRGRPFEADLFVCGHPGCRKTQHAPPPVDARMHTGIPEALGALCHGCGKMICLECAKKRYCETLEQWLMRVEDKWRAMHE